MIHDYELSTLDRDLESGLLTLFHDDPELFKQLAAERGRQVSTLSMVASSSVADPSVLVCAGAAITSLTTEGYPGARFHGGCGVADNVERLAIERAKRAFKAEYANVQPHSCTTANQAVMFSLLRAGDVVLGLDLKAGGHLTHGAKASCSGQYFKSVSYGLTEEGLIDYESALRIAKDHQPRMIICGASSYPRKVDFVRFREIADLVGAILLADVSHIAGLIVAGLHPSPIDVAHITTASTYKQLFGPRGGLILLGKDRTRIFPPSARTLEEAMQRAVFPFFQGTPDLAAIAAKARALGLAVSEQFSHRAQLILRNARTLAKGLLEKNYDVHTGGTDNHIVLVSLAKKNLTGLVAERALEECGMIVNKNVINGDRRPPDICSGIRLGTNTLAYRGMGDSEMRKCVELVDQVLGDVRQITDFEYQLSHSTKEIVSREVAALCSAFPLPGFAS
jgi:glycine hydroxymethyltransferase